MPSLRYNLKFIILLLFSLLATIAVAQLSIPDFGIPFNLNGWTINTVNTGTILLDNNARKIDAHGICKNVQATDGKQYFVPTKSSSEWNSFINGAPSGINLSECDCNSITWSPVRFPASKWQQIDVSSDGQSIVAILSNNDTNGTSDDYLYISHDGGNTYSRQVPLNAGYWVEVAMSGDGQTIMLQSANKYFYLSRDGGNTWRTITSIGSAHTASISISYDGTKIAVAVKYEYLASANGYVYLSSDGGNTWVKQVALGRQPWGDIEIVESNPNIVYAIYSNNAKQTVIYKTDNFGQSWSVVNSRSHSTLTAYGSYIHASQSGKYVISNGVVSEYVTSPDTDVYISSDYGNSWTKINLPPYSIGNITTYSYLDATINDNGVFCIRRVFTVPICSYDQGASFIEQSTLQGAGGWIYGWGSRGANASNNIFVVSGVLSSSTGYNTYIGRCK